MTATFELLDLESAAKELAGNWQEFDCFCWHRKYDLESPEDWGLIYTHNRDSDLLDLSNSEVIAEAMQPFSECNDPDVVFETHSHWAVGHVDGFSIRVFKDGQITKAFRTYYELSAKLADYPILDEENYSAKEYEATLENITDAAWRVGRDYDLPEGWESNVFLWLWDHESSEVENTDDRGGYPSEESLQRAFDALGLERTE
jgi:hypothetical protein